MFTTMHNGFVMCRESTSAIERLPLINSSHGASKAHLPMWSVSLLVIDGPRHSPKNKPMNFHVKISLSISIQAKSSLGIDLRYIM